MPSYLNAVIGEYRITGYLGEGGMGQVYRAVHTLLGHTVAIKILNQGSGDSVLVQRFLNEARIQASLRHPGIAAFYEFTEFRGKPVIVMEFVDGRTIQEITASRGPWRIEDAVPVLCSCAATLEYIHAQGIVHRDLKSANLKITSNGEVKLLDFGIATSQMISRLTTAGFVIGSFQSISPEQARGEQGRAASDIWSFGVLTYEMLTATLPFEGSTQMELFSKIMKASFTPPTVLKPGIPAEMDRIIGRCLRLRPQDRYPSMLALKQDLEQVPFGSSKARRALPNISGLIARRGGFLSSPWLRWGSVFLIAVMVLSLAALMYLKEFSATGSDRGSAPGGILSSDGAGDLKPVIVDVREGSAEVWEGTTLLGHTPYTLSRNRGKSVTLILRQSGFSDLPVQFDVGERAEYTFPMQRSATQP